MELLCVSACEVSSSSRTFGNWDVLVPAVNSGADVLLLRGQFHQFFYSCKWSRETERESVQMMVMKHMKKKPCTLVQSRQRCSFVFMGWTSWEQASLSLVDEELLILCCCLFHFLLLSQRNSSADMHKNTFRIKWEERLKEERKSKSHKKREWKRLRGLEALWERRSQCAHDFMQWWKRSCSKKYQ